MGGSLWEEGDAIGWKGTKAVWSVAAGERRVPARRPAPGPCYVVCTSSRAPSATGGLKPVDPSDHHAI
jgi:hypothetical protein